MKVNDSYQEYERILSEGKERLKELSCINHTTQIIRQGKSVDETLTQVVKILPPAWQYPEHTTARIKFDGKEYRAGGFRETQWSQCQPFETINGREGSIEIYYLKEFETFHEGPFLKEERDLLINLASNLANFINSVEAEELFGGIEGKKEDKQEIQQTFQEPVVSSRQFLQKFINKRNANRDIFHDLMPYKVKEILIVATFYDAFSIEREGRFSDHMLGEYHQLNLSSMPRVTGVTSYEEAMKQLSAKHYDLVILMIGHDRETPPRIAARVKKDYPYIPIYVLLNNDREISQFRKYRRNIENIDRIFVWNGDSKIFFAMIKNLEDRVNVENDTKVGLVRLILLVEDSEKYYSRYLPILYKDVMEQTRRIIEEVSTDDLFKVLRLRARPKILLATSYEEAMDILKLYKESLLCLITDVKFKRNGKPDDQAGFSLVRQVKKQVPGLPTVIQSFDRQNAQKAFELKSIFIDKNSESLIQDVQRFIRHHLGFGNFNYRDANGNVIAVARSLKEFERLIDKVPIESLIYHGKRNHFSLWLMARAEIKIAKMIHPVKVADFKTPQEFRNYLKFVIAKYRNETNTGRVINFEENAILEESNIVSLGTGSLGGKGRGLAFINTLIYNLDISAIIPNIRIRTPITTIIGTDEFDLFLERNQLHEVIYSEEDYEVIREKFLRSELSYNLQKKLKALLKAIQKPIAIRSSSMFEDSSTQPFSGIFATCLLPNNHPEFKVRFKQASDAIKLVYASIFSDQSKAYFKAINFKIEEEKMAIVLQEVVGNIYQGYCYPHISGIAQSYNYYPIAQMKPEDGYAVAAVGLGHYVVEGEKAYRFSPKFPDVEPGSVKNQIRNSQVQFYAIDMNMKEIDFMYKGQNASLKKLDIGIAEKHGTIGHSVSVYDQENDRVEPGLHSDGPRIVNFANILRYEHVPLARAIELILDVVKEALGSPVEIEYAVDLETRGKNDPSFYLLQIKPLISAERDFHLDLDKLDLDKAILFTERSMGNGRIDHIRDVIFVEPERFDKTSTREIAREIEVLNGELVKENKHYILIGPGRWGSRDRFIGIPVGWTQICNARVIVEASIKNFPLDASLGSHFFHNVTSMNVGYFSVNHDSPYDFIRWKALRQQTTIREMKHVRHICFDHALQVLMDGKKQMAAIIPGYPNKET